VPGESAQDEQQLARLLVEQLNVASKLKHQLHYRSQKSASDEGVCQKLISEGASYE